MLNLAYGSNFLMELYSVYYVGLRWSRCIWINLKCGRFAIQGNIGIFRMSLIAPVLFRGFHLRKTPTVFPPLERLLA